MSLRESIGASERSMWSSANCAPAILTSRGSASRWLTGDANHDCCKTNSAGPEEPALSEPARLVLSSRAHYLVDGLIRTIVSLCPNFIGRVLGPSRLGPSDLAGFANRADKAYGAVPGALGLGNQHCHPEVGGFGDLAAGGLCFRLRVHARPFITRLGKNIKRILWGRTKKAAGQVEASGGKGYQATGSQYRHGHPRCA
jgi:hypothetical protein